jgi:hypothetical protein
MRGVRRVGDEGTSGVRRVGDEGTSKPLMAAWCQVSDGRCKKIDKEDILRITNQLYPVSL